MKKPLVLAALLLTGTVAGTAVAATHHDGEILRHLFGHEAEHAEAAGGDGAPFRVADDHRRDRERHHDRDHHRRHHDDDDDDDRGGRNGRGDRLPATGPTDPNAPVPDNGLFQGKARPKVEVN